MSARSAEQRDVTVVEMQQRVVSVQPADPLANLQQRLGEEPFRSHWFLPCAPRGSGVGELDELSTPAVTRCRLALFISREVPRERRFRASVCRSSSYSDVP